MPFKFYLQQLRSKEQEINRKERIQQELADNLARKEQELKHREMELLGRELNMMITQNTPTPKKRRGKFSKARLKVRCPFFYLSINSLQRHSGFSC